MNKKIILCALSAFILTSCEMISFSEDKLKEGFSDGESHSNERVIDFFDGDKNYIDSLGEHISHEISFLPQANDEQPSLKTEADVRAVTVDDDNVIESIENISNVNQFHALKVGNYSNSIDGSIKFNFNKTIVGVKVLAKVRYSTIMSGGVLTPTIDSKVAMNANGSKYISINCDYSPENYQEIKETTCCYSFEQQPTTELSLNVVYQRLEITKITIYE